uniref:ADF-H domain-containing protein n=1 Tax=Sinocyclocheilus grahami TaxID=75366 RepID=A0A672JWU1_SINGR
MRSSSLVVCEVDVSLQEKLKKFRFRKETSNAAILMKIDMEKQLVVLEEEYENISLDELREELPERQCTYIVYSYKLTHGDGRVSYPLCFIFSSPVENNKGNFDFLSCNLSFFSSELQDVNSRLRNKKNSKLQDINGQK